jgi:hypothetical protein
VNLRAIAGLTLATSLLLGCGHGSVVNSYCQNDPEGLELSYYVVIYEDGHLETNSELPAYCDARGAYLDRHSNPGE